MFKSTKPCLCEETNGSYSNAVIGILIITITVFMGLSVLGVWVNALDGSQEETFDLPFIPEKKSVKDIISQEPSLGNKFPEGESGEVSDEALMELCDVSVPEEGWLGCFDTVPGTLKVIEEVLPTEPLPLCIDNEYLADYYLVVESIGGYEPVWGNVILNQMKGDEGYEGKLIAHFDEYTMEGACPCIDHYVITFTTDEPICLDSNHLPEGFDQEIFLDKWVSVCYKSVWQGCHLTEQQFVVMLAHKAMSQNPKLPIYYIHRQ